MTFYNYVGWTARCPISRTPTAAPFTPASRCTRCGCVRPSTTTDHGPFNHCGAITPNFQRLVGVTIGKGFRRRTQRLLGGVAGCTHLVHLLGPMANTAMQTILPLRQRRSAATATRPALLDSCHVFASEVVKR